MIIKTDKLRNLIALYLESVDDNQNIDRCMTRREFAKNEFGLFMDWLETKKPKKIKSVSGIESYKLYDYYNCSHVPK